MSSAEWMDPNASILDGPDYYDFTNTNYCTVIGGGGLDELHLDGSHNAFYGGPQGDKLIGKVAANCEYTWYEGQEGNDEANLQWCHAQGSRLWGGSGTMMMTLFDGQDTFDCRNAYGDIAMFGGGDNDTLRGGSGNDYIQGGAGSDQLWGFEGDDVLDARDDRPFNDVMIGGGQAGDVFLFDEPGERYWRP